MPLHIDYRPQNLDEIVGNKGIVESHKSLFYNRDSDRPHSILYIGPSGCGKTTFARIYASMLDCHKRDITEINAANNRGIDTARKIQESMIFKPLNGSSKCYIIDEVHATSKDFQNAMLKALEDAPDHVYFLLATTDPQKLIPTLKNRCTTFEVNLLSVSELKFLLSNILKAENVNDIPDAVILEIAIVSDGCPRQALVILDQIIDIPVPDMMNAIQDLRVTDKTVKELCQALLYKKAWPQVAEILKSIDMGNPDEIRRSLRGYMAAVLLNAKGGSEENQAALIMELFREPVYGCVKADIVGAAYQSII